MMSFCGKKVFSTPTRHNLSHGRCIFELQLEWSFPESRKVRRTEMWQFLMTFLVFLFLQSSLCVADPCSKHSDCYKISYKNFCCRGQCVTNDTDHAREKGNKCLRPYRSDPFTDHVIIGVFLAAFLTFVVIVSCTYHRCPCYSCYSSKSPSKTSPRHTAVYQTSNAPTTVALTSLGQLYQVSGISQGINNPHGPTQCNVAFFREDERQQRVRLKDTAPNHATSHNTAWEERRSFRLVDSNCSVWTVIIRQDYYHV